MGTDRFCAHPEVVASRIGAELVLVHLGTDRILSLNRTGARIWELVTAGSDPEDLRRRLLDEFDGTPAELEGEIGRFLGALREQDLIRPA